MTSGLTFEHVSCKIGDRQILTDVSFSVGEGQIFCLLGPSGCGKTTTLRLAAGLMRASAGRILIDGEPVEGNGIHIPAEKRRVGLVPQDFALFPHLNIADNVGFGLSGLPKDERDRRVADLLGEVGLAERAQSFPHQLSGGEQQRVSLIRALAPDPRVMLLDEAFSSLDPMTRLSVRDFAVRLLRAHKVPALLVTHDPEEALAVGDVIAVMRAGRIQQIDAPDDIYFQPQNAFVMELFGQPNRLSGEVVGGSVRTPFGALDAPEFGEGTRVSILFRANALTLAAEKGGVACQVHGSRRLGPVRHTELVLDGVTAPLVLEDRGEHRINPGDTVYLTADLSRFHMFPATGPEGAKAAVGGAD